MKNQKTGRSVKPKPQDRGLVNAIAGGKRTRKLSEAERRAFKQSVKHRKHQRKQSVKRRKHQRGTCKPHQWITPKVGDKGLTCGRCKRQMSFWSMSEKQKKDIVASIGRRLGKKKASLFRGAMDSARYPGMGRYPGRVNPKRRGGAQKAPVGKTRKGTASQSQAETVRELERQALRESRQEALRKTLADARRAARYGERPRSGSRGFAEPGRSFTWYPSRRKRRKES